MHQALASKISGKGNSVPVFHRQLNTELRFEKFLGEILYLQQRADDEIFRNCNILQHIATHYNSLQHTFSSVRMT